MPPQDTCVPSSLTLHCPKNYVVIIHTASYGVAQVPDSCSYKPGDCIVDGMSSISCLNDTIQCSIYTTKKKLPQCNDEYSSYFHVEYNCVPISMDDTSKEYNICQNSSTDITTNHGIIRSSGYQITTSECFRTIRIPDNKTIHLWLTDLYIDSTSTNCANDYVYVVDNVQTYKYCGLKRYAYPYLCSSTILIQYLVTTNLSIYRGMRMYFEIIDRSTYDNCPNSTVTPVPITTTIVPTIEPGPTTNTPIYVQLGIASPTRSFQICSDESYTIGCPNNYAIAIIKNIFGVTSSDECEPYDSIQHCIITTDLILSCHQTCSFKYLGNQIIPSCNFKIAAYQYIEYQCIPININLISTNTSCSNDSSKIIISIDRNGRFQSYNYPNITQMNCTYRLKTKIGYIMNIYALDISLNNYIPYCKTNMITLIEDNEEQGTNFCEQRMYSLIYSSCSNELDLRYIIKDASHMFSNGFDLYIESQTRPFDWSCGTILSTPTNPTTIRTTPTTPEATSITSSSFISAFNEVEYDICYGDTLNLACPYGYTFMILNAYYGVKSQISNKCGFVENDCVQEAISTITQCQTDSSNCYLPYITKRRLTQCSDEYADYLHITYQCVPSFPIGTTTHLNVYDICEKNNSIRDFNGVIISPNFSNYTQTNNECKRDIIGINARSLKIWINEMSISSDSQYHLNSRNSNSNQPDLIIYKNNDIQRYYSSIPDICVNDYLILNTLHIIYIYCGKRKFSLGPICTSSVTIQYKTTTTSSNNIYKGFKLYFEWVEKPIEISCPGTPATYDPSALTTTTIPNEPLPIWAQNLDISPILSKYICFNTIESLKCPRSNDYLIAIIDSKYGATETGFCEVPSFSHCFQKVSLSLTCTYSCLIEYNIPKLLSYCQNRTADYLTIDYQCLPTRLLNNENPIDICSSTITDTIAIDKGIIITPQYPYLNSENSCSKKLETLINKLWMIYIIDLFLEEENNYGDCIDTSLIINDGNDIRILCGLQQPQLILTSCSNIVQLNFISNNQTIGYRGFKIFFKTIDIPLDWSCTPSGFTSTTEQTTIRTLPPTTLIPPTLQIAAYGGTTIDNIRQYCQFPFIYQGNQYTKCISDIRSLETISDPWCSLTNNYDIDQQWGYCDIGVTDSTVYDICRNQSQKLQCSDGYVINIITANYAAKLDRTISCIYHQTDCFQSETSAIQIACAGKTLCTVYHIDKTLASCQNRLSAYLHIEYTCVPDAIQDINTYIICNNDSILQDDIRRGFLISPNFPNIQTNINCTYDLQIRKPQQNIYLYIIDMDLNDRNNLGQNCIKDRLIIKSGNSITEWCGLSYTNLILKTCHTSISLQLIRASDAIGRGVKLYFEYRQRSPNEICDETITPTILPTSPGPITIPSRPNYFPNPSPRMLKTLCYPDVSGAYGANNFQCPSDYVIVIHRAFYGKGNRCDYTPGDCINEADDIYRICSGKQACSISFENLIILSNCEQIPAEYLFVEYQCLPTLTIVENIHDLCINPINQLSEISGILQSISYPSYTQTECINTTLTLPKDSNFIIYMYLLDLDIDLPDIETDQCTNDYLLLSYQCHNQLYNQYLCGKRQTEILFDTCSSTDKIYASYNLTNKNIQSHRGFALLYHLLPKTTTITSTTMTTSPSFGPGPVSTMIKQSIVCVQQIIQLQCDMDYVLVLHKIDLAVSRTHSCNYSSDDCFEEHTYLHGSCAGKSSCSFFVPLIPLLKCNNSISNYFYVEYQCIPTKPKLNLNICLQSNLLEKIDSGAIISSEGYISEYKDCKIDLQSGDSSHHGFSVYIIMLNLPEQNLQCNDNNPYIEIEDSQIGITRLCGNSHTHKLFETCSNIIQIRYKNLNISTNSIQYKGFHLYIESIEKKECSDIVTITPPIPEQPFIITEKIVCLSPNDHERVSFSCTSDYGLVFLQSYEFVTNNPLSCDITQQTCHYLSEQPHTLCSGQQSCTYIHSTSIDSQLNMCYSNKSDLIQFFYQCIPMKPTITYSKAIFCVDTNITFNQGFIETPNYPNSYGYGQQQCSLRILLPNTSGDKQLSIYLYIIDLSILDTSIIDSTSPIQCYDSITYRDRKTTRSLCGTIDQPILEYHTDQNELELILNITESLPSNISSNWHGARFFFLIGKQLLPSLPETITTTTRKPNGSEPLNFGLIIVGIISAFLVIGICLFGYLHYRRHLRLKTIEEPSVAFSRDEDSFHDDINSSKNIAVSTFTNPFYKSKITIDETDA